MTAATTRPQTDPSTPVTVRLSRTALLEATEVWVWDDDAANDAVLAAERVAMASRAIALTVPVTLPLAAAEDLLAHLGYTGWYTDVERPVRDGCRRAWTSVSRQLRAQTGKAYRP